MPQNLREADKFNDNLKEVKPQTACPLCEEPLNPVATYTTKGHGNERVTLIVNHLDGHRCEKLVDIIEAHVFEIRATPSMIGEMNSRIRR